MAYYVPAQDAELFHADPWGVFSPWGVVLMNREQAKLLAPIIKAFGDGEVIQGTFDGKPEWADLDDPLWASHWRYRIKPKPRVVMIAYVPGNPWAWLSLDGKDYPHANELPAGVRERDLVFKKVELPE